MRKNDRLFVWIGGFVFGSVFGGIVMWFVMENYFIHLLKI